MARRRYASRRRPGKTDAGAAWISYSDMMAALLLLFVLVLCYSLYQYFNMMDTKTAELKAQERMLNEQTAVLDEQTQQLNSQKEQMVEQQKLLEEGQAQLIAKQKELTGALSTLDEQKGLLDSQTMTLEEQERVILAAQVALQQKEGDLKAAQQDLEAKQSELNATTVLLSQQQQRLDDLVGIRTQIIQALREGLDSAQIKATVDRNTGDIVLESAVFFDVGRADIKDGGQQFLSQFVPIYMSVLLSPEYVGYLGEIIIEGHTDTQGTYLRNLELSQERALSVASYCLQMPELTESQQEQLRGILTAKGRSFSDPIYRTDGSVDMDASRRVEFKFRLKDAEMIDEIRTILAQ